MNLAGESELPILGWTLSDVERKSGVGKEGQKGEQVSLESADI